MMLTNITLEQAKTMYDNIFALLDQYPNMTMFNVEGMKRDADSHLFGIELKEVYGYNINPECVYSREYCSLHNYMWIGRMGGDTKRTISWSNDGKQPNNETLCVIGFSTGAFILGQEYMPSLFNEFFVELKAFNPKYCDDHNSSLYFTLENGAGAFNSLDDLIKKYREKYKKLYAISQIDKLKKQLEQAEQTANKGGE